MCHLAADRPVAFNVRAAAASIGVHAGVTDLDKIVQPRPHSF